MDPAEQNRDEELIARAQRGDAAAFRGLVERWQVTIHRWAVAHLGDPDEADDVTQQVLVRLHLRLHRFRGAARFSTTPCKCKWMRSAEHQVSRHNRSRELRNNCGSKFTARVIRRAPLKDTFLGSVYSVAHPPQDKAAGDAAP